MSKLFFISGIKNKNTYVTGWVSGGSAKWLDKWWKYVGQNFHSTQTGMSQLKFNISKRFELVC